MKQIVLLNPENVSGEEAETYLLCEAVRAIVLDENGMIALLHVARGNHFNYLEGG